MISKYVKDEVIFKNNNYNILITIKNRLELFFTKNWQTNMNEDEILCCPSKSGASSQYCQFQSLIMIVNLTENFFSFSNWAIFDLYT